MIYDDLPTKHGHFPVAMLNNQRMPEGISIIK